MQRMLDIRQKAKLRRMMYAKPTILFLAIMVTLVTRGAWGMYQKSKEAEDKRAKAEERLAELKEKERTLSKDIVDLSTDRGIEEEIRDRFMVAKEGENVMIIADPEEKKVHTVTVSDESPSLMQKMMSATGLSN